MDLHVDRLSFRLSGVSERDGRRLAQLVAQHLATADAGAALRAERLQVRVAAPPSGESLETMAQRIATELLAALARSS